MISIVSMIRRGSVLVTFLFGALVVKEKNIKSKAFDLLLILIGLVFLYLGAGEFSFCFVFLLFGQKKNESTTL